MGLVNTIQREDRNQEIEMLCRNISQDIDNFFQEELYLSEVNFNEELVTDDFRRNCALRLLIGELNTMGIGFTNIDELFEDDFHAKILIKLRTRFDKDNFTNLLRALGEDTQNMMRCYAETDIADDAINNIIHYFAMGFPLDQVWGLLDYYTDTFYSEPRFLDHVLAIVRSISDDPYDNDMLDISVADYAKRCFEHIGYVQKAIKTMMIHANDLFMLLNFEELMSDMQHHDDYFKDVNNLQELALRTPKGVQIYQKHKSESKHHIESYFDKDGNLIEPVKNFTPSVLILLISNWYNPNNSAYFEEHVSSLKQTLQHYPELIGMVDRISDIVRKELYQ